jgi:hypothetical protein
MASPRLHFCIRGARFCGECVATVALWTLWLGLALVFAIQVYLASNRQLELPGFVIGDLEGRLAASGMHATFGRTLFDPSGRVLIQDVRVTLTSFEDPVLTASSVYVKLDPWKLLAGRFEGRELRVNGLSLRVPAMLSASGRSEEAVRDIDAAFLPDGDDLKVEYLSGRVGNLTVLVRGALRLGGARPGRRTPLPSAELLARNFASFSRGFSEAIERLGAFDQAVLRVRLAPSKSGGAMADLVLLARGLNLTAPVQLQASDLQASTRAPILGTGRQPIEIRLEAGDLRLSRGDGARNIRVRIRGFLGPGALHLDARELELAASSAKAQGAAIGAPFATVEPGPLPKLRAEACGWLMDSPMAVGADADLKAQTADLRFDGELAPAVVDLAAARLGRDLRKFAAPAAPAEVSGGARFGPGWKFERVEARVAVHGLKAHGVPLDDVRGRIEFDGQRLMASEVSVRAGENYAHGSYEQQVASRDFRFLMEGRLRPLFIAPWFPRWWTSIFKNFGFPAEPPAASVDVGGRWTDPKRTSTFAQVDSARPVVGGISFERVRTRFFVRPTSIDGLEVVAARGPGEIRGAFARRISSGAAASQNLEFEGISSLDPRVFAKFFSPSGAAFASHIAFEKPPVVNLKGWIRTSKSSDGPHRAGHFELGSEGPLQFYDWPLDQVSFDADLRDDELKIDSFGAAFAGGTAAGRIEIHGRGADRQVDFSASCADASLSQAIAAAAGYLAQRKGGRPVAPTTFLKEKTNVRFTLSVSAKGRYADPYSYEGRGKVSLQGAELGGVRMLGLLSELIRFTSLRFTSAHADFQVAGRQLIFPNVSVTGANSGIEARGIYALDKHELDFRAKIYPFKQSKMLPQILAGAVLTPLSYALEVRLTGSVTQPSWKLVNGPSNLLYNLAQPSAAPLPKPGAPSKQPASPAPAAPPPSSGSGPSPKPG